MDEQRRNQSEPQRQEPTPRQDTQAQEDRPEDQTISVGQSDNLQAESGENFYQNRQRGNMPEPGRQDEGGGSLF